MPLPSVAARHSTELPHSRTPFCPPARPRTTASPANTPAAAPAAAGGAGSLLPLPPSQHLAVVRVAPAAALAPAPAAPAAASTAGSAVALTSVSKPAPAAVSILCSVGAAPPRLVEELLEPKRVLTSPGDLGSPRATSGRTARHCASSDGAAAPASEARGEAGLVAFCVDGASPPLLPPPVASRPRGSAAYSRQRCEMHATPTSARRGGVGWLRAPASPSVRASRPTLRQSSDPADSMSRSHAPARSGGGGVSAAGSQGWSAPLEGARSRSQAAHARGRRRCGCRWP